MQIRMLGPLQMIHVRPSGETPLLVTAAKQRAVLAVLLINLNRVVPLERLINELWDEAPPTAANLVRQYVSHLRKALAAAHEDGAELRTHGAGYLLTVPDRTCDADEFERLTSTARALLADGRCAEARQTVAGALRLWRGQAFADVPEGRLICAERERLEELRIGCQELGALADLAAGDVVAAISSLKAMVVRHPLRESLHAALIRALSAAGRKADALAAYRSARGTIVDELGLEPSEELRQLERAILVDELTEPTPLPMSPAPTGLAPISPAVGAEFLSPAQARMPADVADFVGRGALIARVGQVLGVTDPAADPPSSPPVVVISGIPGIGKTALAVRLGHQLRHAFPDGQVFLRLSGRTRLEPDEALGRILEVLGHPPVTQPGSPAGRENLYRHVLADRRVLLVLDAAVDEEQVRGLVPGRSPAAVLVTSRSRLAGLEGAKHLAVPAFSSTEAVRLLALVAGPERVSAEPEAARAIGRLCGGLPAAVRAAGARLGALPHRQLHHLAEQLRGDRVFDELVVGDMQVRPLMAAAYAELGEDDRRMLCELARSVETSLSVDLPPLLSEQELGISAYAVDRLVEAGALDVATGDGRVQFSRAELLMRYARQHVDTRGRDSDPAAAPHQ